jgi:two-component system sensor histidine kinase DctS
MSASAATQAPDSGRASAPIGSQSLRRARVLGLTPHLRNRWVLWSLLVALLAGLLGLLAFLTGRYEASAVQDRLDAQASALASDVRNGLGRNLRALQALPIDRPAPWQTQSADLMQQRREIVRIERRNEQLQLKLSQDTPARPSVFNPIARSQSQADVKLACSAAQRFNSPAFSSSYFLPQADGRGLELMDLCIAHQTAGALTGYTVATYSLGDILAEMVGPQLPRGYTLAFTDPDGTRLALYGQLADGLRLYTAQSLLDLTGNTLVLRLDTLHGTSALFPNPLSALVSTMALALALVLMLLVLDMRRRQRVESELAEALAFRKAMEDSLSTGLRARDLQGNITYVNPAFCRMVGFEARHLLQQGDPAPYWPPELAPAYKARQQDRHNNIASLRGGVESVFMRSDGTRFPVLIMEAPLINAQGRHTGWMSAVVDLSEQKRAEDISRASQDRLQAAARLAMVGEMASLLSHELNQPLAAISSYANGSINLMQDAAPASAGASAVPVGLQADLMQALQRIAQQAERAGRVIRSVHDFVRRRDQRREAVAPRDLIEAVMPLVGLQARKLGIEVLLDLAPDTPEAVCDRTMVEQVLLNLARNGMQAMQGVPADAPARQLRLRVRPAPTDPKGWVEFSVSDRGHGVSQEVAQQLFTPFFTTKEEGMGLGLSLCRTVVEQHGGLLHFEPNPPQGTTFRFTLPAHPSGPDLAAP